MQTPPPKQSLPNGCLITTVITPHLKLAN